MPSRNSEWNGGRSTKLINLYSNRYINNCCNLTKPYTEIPKLLEMLKTGGARAAVLSNKPQAQSDEVVSKLFEKDMFYMVIGHGSGFAPKPSPDSFNYLVNCAGVKKSDVCYVGDSNVDIMLGKNAGVDTIGAEWGFRGRKELEDAGAVYIAKHPLEILDIIKEIQ